ncbi:MAG: DEAD/DEAH box helicase [Desulfomonile tiedjei]|nr:DEAD/DEAH box helicase [Desulfomonile tiedjei]
MEPLAHSARLDKGIPAQPYAEHVCHVMELAVQNARQAARYWHGDKDRFVEAVRLAGEFHDLGKLEAANQAVLMSESQREALPVNHVDAGVAHLFDAGINNLLAASLVYAHHIGLPDFQDQSLNGPGRVLRDVKPGKLGRATKSITDQRLDDYLELHGTAVDALIQRRDTPSRVAPSPLPPLIFRIALSCLVDADHSDTAGHYGKVLERVVPPLQPELRLALLDQYVAHLEKAQKDERNTLRGEVYRVCRDADPHPRMFACDSPVGTGKTTAVMAHLLQAARAKGLRRIFVVLPFTNIIDQSVEVYRKALVSKGERPEDVVAAHHHKAEFEDLESRHLSFLWKAPIVITTAVQFFETLASNRPASLRKVHQLPGSAIFIDEAHAALPAHLWPQAWRWLRELESQWGCHFVLGSGSLNRFWKLEEFSEERVDLPELVHPHVKAKVKTYEERRVTYLPRSGSLSEEDLLDWLPDIHGPRLLIVNTVQSAAVIAASIEERSGRESVEHLSTSLCPRDRKASLARVRRRLDDQSDTDWTLVATSCVEAGVNLSFRNGLRERCSLNSLIQMGGRVSREGEFLDSAVWDFKLQHGRLLKDHPAFKDSARILGELFREGNVCAEASTEAMRREIRQGGLRDVSNVILKAERNLQFPIVAEKFTVIDSDTVTVIVDLDLIESLKSHEKVDPDMIQRSSVQIWRYREHDYNLESVPGFRGLYRWTLGYDDFLGYMAGVLPILRHQQHGTVI